MGRKKRRAWRSMSVPRIASLVAALLLTPLLNLGAQDTLVGPGAKVRVYAPDRLVGIIEELNPDGLLLRLEDRDSPQAIPFASITRLEVSRGKKSRFLKGLGVGLLLGAVSGTAIGFASSDDPPWFFSFSAEAAVLGVLGGLAGGVIGGVIGATTKVDRWQELPLDQIRVTLMPYEGPGLTVSATVAF